MPVDENGQNKPEKKNSLLIANGNDSTLTTLTCILEPEYVVYTATNGPDAVELAKKHLPDLILLDIVMPGMDGYEALSVLKNTEQTQEIPIIFITALGDSKDEERGLSCNAVDYIRVPYDAQIIRLRVRNQINIVNQIRTIKYLIRIDQLTNIANRRYFDERIRSDWGMAIREKTSLSILMIDVDKFKDFNDNYGHQQGDSALQSVAAVFSQTLKRSGDFIARWGGEEFIALLPNTNLAGALKVAEGIRKNVENTDVLCMDGSVRRVTVSIGVNSQIPVFNSSMDNFISGADKALYDAKNTGRNRVCRYNNGTP
jgi:diguanylate cyclase (GGDEF)-like protein